ncbi:winged helix DNA-binding domain-containing protein [Actinoplanes sp. NPDC051861]|uniref:winged helix DNA-binding domain-containing protein n=1 Tax=Actinoplanes sp. NPDC051861 TaxID=3155170 RepID=UPI0034423D63
MRRAPLTVPEALTRLGGLQAQTPHTWYVGLWSRLEDYTPEPTARLLTDRAIVRMALMRSTIHLVTADDCRWLRPLVEPVIVRSTMGAFGRHLRGIDRDQLVAAALSALAAQPMIFSELGRALAPSFPGHDPAALAQAARAWTPLVQVPPRGVWGRSGRPAHVPMEHWLGVPVDPSPRVETLFLRYLAAFGPATVRDAQQWSGLTRLAEVADRLRPSLVTFRDTEGRELFDLPDAPRPDPGTPAPVRFLYDFDNLLLSHADRSRVVGGVDYAAQGWGGGNMEQPRSLLVDGFVAATWKIAGGVLTVRPFRRLSGPERDEIAREGAALVAFHAPRADPDNIVFRED